jgi:hypothetical protein
MILTSLKTNVQAMVIHWGYEPTVQNYVDVFARIPVFQYMVN